MAAISVTYTFSNGTASDATQVNTNFTDIINGTSDGTKDLSVNAVTAAGTATFNGNTNIGNASGDDLTITASLASTIAIKTANTYNIGAAGTGLDGIYINSDATHTIFITGSSSGSPASWTFTIPSTSGSAGQGLQNSGSGTMVWAPMQTSYVSKSADYVILDTDGYRVVDVDATSAAVNITLPAASTNTGRIITIRVLETDTSNNIVTITRAGSDTINGATTRKMAQSGCYYELISTGSGWKIINMNVFEYAYNTDVADSNDTGATPAFAYGPTGQRVPTSTFGATRLKRIRFKVAYLPGDTLSFEVDVNADGTWQTMSGWLTEADGDRITAYMVDSGVSGGIGSLETGVGTTTTDADVVIGKYAELSGNFGATGTNWSSTYITKWRVRKRSNI